MRGLVPVQKIAGNGFYACNNPLLWALQMHASRLACSGSPILVTLRFKITSLKVKKGGLTTKGINAVKMRGFNNLLPCYFLITDY